MNDGFSEAVCFVLGVWVGCIVCYSIIQVDYIVPCERELSRKMHCELTAKISGDKHE